MTLILFFDASIVANTITFFQPGENGFDEIWVCDNETEFEKWITLLYDMKTEKFEQKFKTRN